MPEKTWQLSLNKYQRDNLLWLLVLAMEGSIPEAYTGDWAHEIARMLGEFDKDTRPNMTLDDYRRRYGIKKSND